MGKFLIATCLLVWALPLFAADLSVSGALTDPQGQPVADAKVTLSPAGGHSAREVTTDVAGHFDFYAVAPGEYTLSAQAPGFVEVHTAVSLSGEQSFAVNLEFKAFTSRRESVTVTEDVDAVDVFSPDPAQRVLVRQETLDANPGRPGVPVSIPGIPAETASSGIKAPQYFAPGVAGDHGEPIGQFFQVGTFLVPNNLPANAHGNGYADPNVVIPQTIESVRVDGGSYNVREGNNSVNLAATYGFRERLEPSVTVTGDYRDMDVVAGWSPEGPEVHSWLALQVSFGNGFLQRAEHRRQYKLNGYRVFKIGRHQLTLMGLGYYGFSYIPGLVPLDIPDLHDTIDPRQRDQTHTSELIANDVWHLSPGSELQISGFFRTYNLSLYSNFGGGLIRQSEFRTVAGGNTTYLRKITKSFTVMTGLDYRRDAPRRLDLDRYESTDPSYYGPFQPVTANNVTLGFISPYIALDGFLTRYLHYDLGIRRDEVSFNNVDLLNPANSFHAVSGINSPKGTLAFVPRESRWKPSVAFSFGQSFYTNDPRIGTGGGRGSPVSRSHAYQLVASKQVGGVDFRVTLGHATTEQSLAKIDPDTGLQYDEGPSRLRFITTAARRYFRWGLIQGSVSLADARDLLDGTPVPEAPRRIVDVLGTFDRLPFHLHARGEFEEVGRKPLGDGFVAVPVREFRGALSRPILQGRMDIGLNFLIASGYTGQTTEVLALPGESDAFERVAGVALPSYVSLSVTYRFRPRSTP